MGETVPHETNPPEWLDQTYVRDILKKGLRQDNLEVTEMEIEPATAAGDHYASQMFRLHTVIKKDKNKQPEKLNLIIKTLPDSTFADELKKDSVFQKESEMFLDILPAIDVLLKKAYPDHEALHAAGYGFDDTHSDIIFLQDLRDLGFQLADRLSSLDSAHTNLVVTSLAKYHAASVVHIKNHPEVKEKFDENLWNMSKASTFRQTFKNATDGYFKLVQTWPDGPEKEKALKKLQWLDKEFLIETMENYKRDDSALNVLIHGDCWINNLMFKYENGKPVSIKLVDYQLACYNTPAIDLVYFTFTSQSDEVRFGNTEELLRLYYQTFTETLKRLDFVLEKPFTFDELKNEFYKKLMFGLSSVLLVFPITVCPPAKVVKLDDFLGDGQDVSHLYNNETMNIVLRKAIEFFDKHGTI